AAVAAHPLPVTAASSDSTQAPERGQLTFLDNAVDSLTGTVTGKASFQRLASPLAGRAGVLDDPTARRNRRDRRSDRCHSHRATRAVRLYRRQHQRRAHASRAAGPAGERSHRGEARGERWRAGRRRRSIATQFRFAGRGDLDRRRHRGRIAGSWRSWNGDEPDRGRRRGDRTCRRLGKRGAELSRRRRSGGHRRTRYEHARGCSAPAIPRNATFGSDDGPYANDADVDFTYAADHGPAADSPMNVSERFIRRPVMTILVMTGITVFGVVTYRSLPISDLPTVDYPTINVNASLAGASPQTMAAAVATPLEKQ